MLHVNRFWKIIFFNVSRKNTWQRDLITICANGTCCYRISLSCRVSCVFLGHVSTLFGKSTHISMISNSVTHLRSYANSAIADIAENSAPISPWTPRDRRHHSAYRRHRRAKRRRLRIERRYRRIEWWVFKCFVMFHNVLSVSWCFTSGSRCITMFYMCFTMFYMCFMMFYYV